ncbi:hypothetical protein NSP_26290 [Nodularia spumigena CCY9414]|nr:hypothetical protein NSP_26290 [Nodularia spumigena CCY9414]
MQNLIWLLVGLWSREWGVGSGEWGMGRWGFDKIQNLTPNPSPY